MNKFLFVGARLSVLESMLEAGLNTKIFILADTWASKELAKRKVEFQTFSKKAELLGLITNTDFDVFISNGCPYILPISQIKKEEQVFVNIHPSLLPDLKGNSPVNGAILFNKTAGATAHIMDDGIDTGEIISQVGIWVKDLSLKLLYQLSFKAEQEAFMLALKNDFKPTFEQNKSGNYVYFSRKDDDLLIDFRVLSNEEILRRIKAFNIKNQYARLEFQGEQIKIISAKILKNPALNSIYEKQNNKVLLTYENCFLIKKDNEFLEFECVENNAFLLENYSFESLSYLPFSPYHQKEYARLNLAKNDKIFEFNYKENSLEFYNISIKSKIPNTDFYDLCSPYGFAGILCNTNNNDFIKRALNAQKEQALKQNIIAEFMRFNPCLNIGENLKNSLDFFAKGNSNVAVYCDNSRFDFYSQRLKSKINKAKREIYVKQSSNIEQFVALYYETMKRNDATDFYFFKQEYFENLLKNKNTIMFEACFNGKIISMAIFIFDEKAMFYHLGANSTEQMKSNNNAIYAIFECAFDFAYNKGIPLCYLGGGVEENDELFAFKKQFASFITPFYIGGVIYNKEIYEELKNDKPYFLSYRF
ncbi:MAG: hypothetical protein MSA54_04690 [Campylobacter sp.]|uniref:formyltransferase family protein n=1 Tax=Campylobacter sp. TaxID=205 RepID=UPI002AA6AC3F|nr:formyltransferase family protein [Campylobacter sp.]MCI7501223.1 hypothetical protein [Campylobacter sp.]